jgi:hypothetical protein
MEQRLWWLPNRGDGYSHCRKSHEDGWGFVVGLLNALAASQLTDIGIMRRIWILKKVYRSPLGVSQPCGMAGEAMVIARCI